MNEVEIPLKITGIAELKAELRGLQGAIASATNPEQVAELSAKAGELRDRIRDANEAVNVFASGSKFEQVSNSLGGIKDSLMSLDFQEANDKAQVFSNIIGKLNPGDISKGFKGFTAVIQTMGGAFVKLGIQILANPIFLLVAVITAIVVAIGIFLKKIGVLDAVLKVIMGPLNAVIQGFKDLTDWLGLTDNAAEENAEKVKETSKVKEDALKSEMAARRNLLSLTQDLTEEEKQQIEQQLGIAIERNQTQEDLAIEESERQMAINEKNIASLEAKKHLTDEEKKDLEGLYKNQVDLNNNIIQNEVAKINKKRELLLSVDKQIEMLNAKQIKNETERSKAMLDIQEKEAIATIQKEKNKAIAYGATPQELAKFDQLIVLTQQEFQRQRLEITNKGNAGVAKANSTANSNSLQETKSNQAKKLEELKKANETEYLNAQNLNKSEQELRDLRITQLEAERKYLFENLAKIYKKESDQKAALAKLDNDLKKAKDKNAEEQEKKENEQLIASLQRKELNAQDDFAKFEAQKELIAAESKIKMDALEVGSEERLLLEDETAQKLNDIDKEITAKKIEEEQKRLAAIQLVAETKFSQEQFNLERSAKTDDEKLAALQTLLDSELDVQAAQKETELANKDLSEQEIAAIEEKYRQQKIVAEENAAKKIEEIKKESNARIFKAIDQGLETSVQGLNAITSLLTISQNRKLKNVEKGSKEEEKILKQQFKQQKAMQLAMAAINGAQAITAILSVPDFTLGIASGIRIAAAIASTAAAISTISATTFEGGGTPPDLNTDTTSSAASASPATPNINLFGGANQFNNLGSTGQNNGQTVTVQAVVSETDITNVQNKIANIQKNAEL